MSSREKQDEVVVVDDDVLTLGSLLRYRFPAITLGMLIGFAVSFLTSRFEEVLVADVEVAFFIPFIVYMGAAVASQTETILVRDEITKHSNIKNYLRKEALVGLVFGAFFGAMSALITNFWLNDYDLALVVGLSMFITVVVSPLISLGIIRFTEKYGKDPAVMVGPLASVAQDAFGVAVYGIIASWILL